MLDNIKKSRANFEGDINFIPVPYNDAMEE